MSLIIIGTLIAAVIIISIMLYNFFTGYMINTIISKLTKPSFRLGLHDAIDLFIAYFVALAFFLHLVKYSGIPLENIGIPKEAYNYLVLFIGLSIIYYGRFITRVNGVIYGKVHFISIFLLSTFFSIFNFIQYLYRDLLIHSDKGFNISNSSLIVDSIWNLYLNHFKVLIDHPNMYFTGIIIGIGCISSIGEYYLGRSNPFIMIPDKRTLMQLGDKLPSDMEVITWNGGIKNKINEIFETDKKLISIRCITKSCRLVKDIYEAAIKNGKLFDNNGKLSENTDWLLRVIKCPDPVIYRDLEKIVEDAPFPWNYFINKNFEYNEMATTHKERVRYLNENMIKYIKSQNIKIKNYNPSDWKIAIFEFEDNYYKILIITSDKSVTRPSRIGLYSEQPYIIEHFIDNFDSLWENIKETDKNISDKNICIYNHF